MGYLNDGVVEEEWRQNKRPKQSNIDQTTGDRQ